MQQNGMCRLWGDRDEMVNHISECSKLVQRDNKIRCDWIKKMFHLEWKPKRTKRDNYLDHARELRKLWNMWVTEIQIEIDGMISKGLENKLEELENGG